MGKLFSKKTKKSILLLGEFSSGKQTLLYSFKYEVKRIEYGFFSVFQIENDEFIITSWDTLPHKRYKEKEYTDSYFRDADGIIYVVDSSNEDLINFSKIGLRQLIDQDIPKNIPILLFYNKQDLKNSLSNDNVSEKLNVEEISVNRNLNIQGCSFIDKIGVKEGFDWLEKNMDLDSK